MIEETGLNEMIANLRKIQNSLKSQLPVNFFDICSDTLQRCKPRIPIDTGELVDSDFIELNEKNSDYLITMGFTADHATLIHEDVTMNHPNGGEAKFLENQVKEDFDLNLQELADEINKIFGGFK